MEQERNNSDENIKFSHIKYNSELENMYFSDSDFITCFRNFKSVIKRFKTRLFVK